MSKDKEITPYNIKRWKAEINIIAKADGRGSEFCRAVLINEAMYDDGMTPEDAYCSECVGLDSL